MKRARLFLALALCRLARWLASGAEALSRPAR